MLRYQVGLTSYYPCIADHRNTAYLAIITRPGGHVVLSSLSSSPAARGAPSTLGSRVDRATNLSQYCMQKLAYMDASLSSKFHYKPDFVGLNFSDALHS
ncbi:hypothetical protein ASPBRDRAFT_438846 [Aspergillus brasiliensis CBS 101740]|uniref:Uncharacterized protein n=1 Tax=Aspergillus brasiliensis (strain CBS 101740 / IMI 381727 / IBT 21946) TaxID=767769 RepID=A0A1L9UR05_ASPBC|nr:hypothetical protein ASPBRDRAFT_438846 [Aspergillus brasiliensis CBS 101740]